MRPLLMTLIWLTGLLCQAESNYHLLFRCSSQSRLLVPPRVSIITQGPKSAGRPMLWVQSSTGQAIIDLFPEVNKVAIPGQSYWYGKNVNVFINNGIEAPPAKAKIAFPTASGSSVVYRCPPANSSLP